jgi:ATP-binding protein involved in chromosome partitioning
MENGECDKTSGCSSCGSANQCDEKSRKEHEDRILQETLAAIQHKVFILSGKGGVGKSTVAVNLAASLAARGYETGILDIDIHGPNVSKMLGIEGWALSSGGKENKISPFRPFPHLKVISMAGLLPDSDAPVIWRGPLKMAAIRQFLQDVAWGPLNFLVVDSPPGTGDEPLSIAQLIPDADGAVIVTTPQEVALLDSRKCVNFAKKLNLPVLGIIENMSGMRCPHCDGLIPLFSQGGGKKAAEELDVPFLGALPIAPDMPESCDRGQPYVLSGENNELKDVFEGVVKGLVQSLEKNKKRDAGAA